MSQIFVHEIGFAMLTSGMIFFDHEELNLLALRGGEVGRLARAIMAALPTENAGKPTENSDVSRETEGEG